jgi:hypothetical protein
MVIVAHDGLLRRSLFVFVRSSSAGRPQHVATSTVEAAQCGSFVVTGRRPSMCRGPRITSTQGVRIRRRLL